MEEILLYKYRYCNIYNIIIIYKLYFPFHHSTVPLPHAQAAIYPKRKL